MARGELFTVSITGVDDLKKLHAFLDPKLMAKAARGGIKYAARAATTSAAKEIRSRYNISSARIKSDITLLRVDDQALTATLSFSRQPPSILQYGGVDLGKGRGLHAKVKRSEPRLPVVRGFIIKHGKLAGKPFRRITEERDSRIAFVSGPSIGSIFLRDGQYADVMQAAVKLRINEQFIKGFERVLSSAARGYGK